MSTDKEKQSTGHRVRVGNETGHQATGIKTHLSIYNKQGQFQAAGGWTVAF